MGGVFLTFVLYHKIIKKQTQDVGLVGVVLCSYAEFIEVLFHSYGPTLYSSVDWFVVCLGDQFLERANCCSYGAAQSTKYEYNHRTVTGLA